MRRIFTALSDKWSCSAIFNNEWVVSEVSLPISNLGDFAANGMGLFFGCIGFGFIAAFVLTNVFNPD